MKKPVPDSGLIIALSAAPPVYGAEPEAERPVTLPRYRLMAGKDIQKSRVKPDIYLQITPDNIVTVFIGKSEMGQGVFTSLPMALADELDADWDLVRCEVSFEGREFKDPLWGSQATGGSTSVRHMYEPVRLVGAAARKMLIAAAARMWGVPEDECETAEGAVSHAKSGRRFTYGELCKPASRLEIPKDLRLKEKGQFRLIGRPMPGLDIRQKVNGTALFGTDMFVEGMLYAAVERPPLYGAKMISSEEKDALKVPGVRHVVPVSSGWALCADTMEALLRGRKALNIKWGVGSHPDLENKTLETLFLRKLTGAGKVAHNSGNAIRILKGVARKIKSTYFLPYLAHAPLEPMCCTARVLEDRCDIWAPTQNQSDAIQSASEITGLKPEQIYVHTMYIGGGFGRRLEADYAQEAVEISKATGRAVKLLWTRQEDMRNDFYRPASVSLIEGGLDEKGRLVAWNHKIAAPSIYARVSPDAMEKGVDPAAVEGIVEMDYEIPNLRIEYMRVDTPIPVGFWRSVGHSHNAFTVECFVDELASAAGKDPLEFRLDLLREHHRTRRVLEVAAEKAGWGKSLPEGRGRGIAQHFSYGSYVAQVAEVSVDKDKGKIKVHKVVCAVDCGRAINPKTIEAQITGGIIFGLSAALKEEVIFDKGGVKTANFNDYQILRMGEAPETEVHIIESGEALGGIGEVAVPPIAPAVANAVFNAVGIRIHRLPMKRIASAFTGVSERI